MPVGLALGLTSSCARAGAAAAPRPSARLGSSSLMRGGASPGCDRAGDDDRARAGGPRPPASLSARVWGSAGIRDRAQSQATSPQVQGAIVHRMVVIECNEAVPVERSVTVPFDLTFRWDHTDYHGASLAALDKLGRSKFYTLVYANGVNAF